ncbi:MAG: class I SAM-dependent methyltransferase [Limisphaerales bacterium]
MALGAPRRACYLSVAFPRRVTYRPAQSHRRPARASAVALEAPPARLWWTFLRELAANPRAIGAACPSSPALARKMVEFVEPQDDALVIELGGGTGAVTEALLERGVEPRRLMVVEQAPNLARLLRDRFPAAHVVGGDAAQLRAHLRRWRPRSAVRVSHIISSLPLRSLSPVAASAILAEIGGVLAEHRGLFLQYTYALASVRHVPPGLRRRASGVVWWNIPPARVDVFSPG